MSMEPPAYTPPGPPAPPEPPQPPGFPQPPGSNPPEAALAAEGTGTAVDDTRPVPGDLQLKGRRAWKTWQLVLAVLIAAFIGMWINGNVGSASTTGTSSAPAFHAPPPNSAGSTTTTVAGGAGAGSGSATTTTTPGGAAGAAGATTTTTAAGATPGGSTTGTTAPLGQESYLVPEYQSSGNWTSPAFNIAGSTWYIGWAFSCNPVPAAKPTFSVYVVTPPGSSPSGTPAVTSNDAQGQSVTNLTSTGSQQLVVQSPPQCKWAVKVTGYGGG